MKSLRLLGAAVTVAALTLAGCGSSAGDPSNSTGNSNPFRIVFISGLTGALQTPSQSALTSIKAAIDLMNKNGGIDGRQITLDVGDSQSDPTRAVTLLQEKLASEAKPDLVWAGLSSGESQAMLPVLTREKIFSLLQSASPALNDAAQYPYNFAVTPDSNGFWGSLPDYIREHDVKKVVAILPQSGFGDGTVTALRKNLGGVPVDFSIQRFNDRDVDLAPVWQKAGDSKPDLLIADCFGDSCARLFAGRTSAGLTGVRTIYGTGPSSTGKGPAGFAKPADYENALLVVPSFMVWQDPTERSEAFQRFFDTVKAANGGTVTGPLVPQLHPWDELKLAKLAYERSKTDDVDDLVKQVYALNEGRGFWVSGWDLHYDDKNHFPISRPGDFVFAPIGDLVDGMFKS